MRTSQKRFPPAFFPQTIFQLPWRLLLSGLSYLFPGDFKRLAKLHFYHPSISLTVHHTQPPSSSSSLSRSLSTSPPSMSLSLSSIHCCGEFHTISASVCCCPGNRDTKNRSIFFTPDISGAQSYCFYWHRAFSHPFNWPLACISSASTQALFARGRADPPAGQEATAEASREASPV